MNNYYKFINLPLPYPFDAMEPFIDIKTMELHHNRHLQTYIDNLNAVLVDCPWLQHLSLEQLICTAQGLTPNIRNTVKNNAGGVYNHRFYFDGLANPVGELTSGRLYDAIIKEFSGMEQFKNSFKTAALSVFGSGYAWLTSDRRGRLKIITTASQDTPLTLDLCPILTIDVWEHAYYLKHYNKRVDYIDDWFHVLNWKKANDIYFHTLFDMQ